MKHGCASHLAGALAAFDFLPEAALTPEAPQRRAR
jgi:hypothetical protein